MTTENQNSFAQTAKIEWFRELIENEPTSKVFLPFARILVQVGQESHDASLIQEALGVLQTGLEQHPQYIEARLFHIELLNLYESQAKCAAEVARLARIFLHSPDFWAAWNENNSLGKDVHSFSLALGFMSAIVQSKDLNIAQVFEAGLSHINQKTQNEEAMDQHSFDIESSFTKPRKKTFSEYTQPAKQGTGTCFDSVEDLQEKSSSYSNAYTQEDINSSCFDTDCNSESSFEAHNCFSEKTNLETTIGTCFQASTPTEYTIDSEVESFTHSQDEGLLEQDAFVEQKDFIEQNDFAEQKYSTQKEYSLKQEQEYTDTFEQEEMPKRDNSLKTQKDTYSPYETENLATIQKTLRALTGRQNITINSLEKSPFCTKTMAHTLLDQGDRNGAIKIYQELLQEEENPIIKKELEAVLLELCQKKSNSSDCKKDEIILEQEKDLEYDYEEYADEDYSLEENLGSQSIENNEAVDTKKISDGDFKASSLPLTDILNQLADRLDARASS